MQQQTPTETTTALGFPAHWPAIAVQIWDQKYRLKRADGSAIDQTWRDTAQRVAKAAARGEAPADRKRWTAAYADAITDFAFLPAGRILAGAGTKRRVTLFNCFVLGRIEDDLSAIFDQVKEAALTMQQGGGIGHDFSTLRPLGAPVKSIGADASGPVTFMDVWDAMCRTIMSAGARRGAMMGTLRCDHPDIEAFIDVKRDASRLRNFNLSVLVTDAFVAAVKADASWDLVFDGTVYRTLPARALWERMMRATYDVAEPGVIFIDRINGENNLSYCETIQATNPCGEQPLPPHGACLLGSINLAQLVVAPFTSDAHLDLARLRTLVATAVRFLDSVIDVSGYPLKAQRAEALAKRRIGLGITGLADALIAVGVRYGTSEALALTDTWLAALKCAGYRASAALAAEKGAFPLCHTTALLARPGLQSLPDDVRAQIAQTGLRNGLITSVAPTGTISLLAGNVSSGIEPVFAFSYDRRVLQRDGSAKIEAVEDYAHAAFRRHFGTAMALPAAFTSAADLSPAAHLEMQATAQRHIDSAISKTVNCPEDIAFDAFKDVYLQAHALGLKGVTTYRPNAVTGSVLIAPAAVVATADFGLTAPERSTRLEPSLVAALGDRDPSIVYMMEPMARAPILAGLTYKLKWPGSDHAMYITVNDIEVDGRRRPFEIFINSKNLEHYAWTLALTRMISAIFRRGGDVAFVVDELKAVFDPQGGRWLDGRYVPSLLAAIGEVIETHLKQIGFLSEASAPTARAARPRLRLSEAQASDGPVLGGQTLSDQTPSSHTSSSHTSSSQASSGFSPPDALGRGRSIASAVAPVSRGADAKFCPRCSAHTYVRREACWVCDTCGHSTCG